MSKLQVFHFLLDHRIGGPHIYVDTLRNKLEADFASTVVTTGKGEMTDKALINIRHLWKPFYIFEILINVALLSTWVIKNPDLRNNTIFAVHGAANITPLIVARIFNLPLVWYIHETVSNFSKFVKFGKWILKNTRYKIAVVALKAREIYNIPDSIYLPGSVDERFWAYSALPEMDSYCSVDTDSLSLRLLTVSNLNPLKGLDILLEALSGIKFGWHLSIAGPVLSTHADYAQSIQNQANAILSERADVNIDFLGWQSKESIRSLLAQCDVFVLPSRSEACPISLLEAMSMGVPCIAARVGDVSAMLQDDDKSKIFEVGSAVSCRQAIIEFRETLCKKGKERRNSTIPKSWKLDEVLTRTKTTYSLML